MAVKLRLLKEGKVCSIREISLRGMKGERLGGGGVHASQLLREEKEGG